MATFAGLSKPEDRINLIAFLRTNTDGTPVAIPAPAPAAAPKAAPEAAPAAATTKTGAPTTPPPAAK